MLVGIDQGLSFTLRYFEVHRLKPNWSAFLHDFQLRVRRSGNSRLMRCSQVPAGSDCWMGLHGTIFRRRNFRTAKTETNMPIILWFLGVPLVVVLLLMLTHVI
jgi:hypothetical protein